jgi:glycerol-3-phosphate acyltransferase PlsY
LLLDGGKGAVAVLAAQTMGPDMAVLAATGALLGHLFPVWLKFKGGKGVATFLGITLAIAWPAGVLCCITWLLTALIFRFSSLASLAASAGAPVYMFWFADPQRMELAAALALLIFVRHYQNIRRLLRGEEPKIGKSSNEKSPDDA